MDETILIDYRPYRVIWSLKLAPPFPSADLPPRHNHQRHDAKDLPAQTVEIYAGLGGLPGKVPRSVRVHRIKKACTKVTAARYLEPWQTELIRRWKQK